MDFLLRSRAVVDFSVWNLCMVRACTLRLGVNRCQITGAALTFYAPPRRRSRRNPAQRRVKYVPSDRQTSPPSEIVVVGLVRNRRGNAPVDRLRRRVTVAAVPARL